MTRSTISGILEETVQLGPSDPSTLVTPQESSNNGSEFDSNNGSDTDPSISQPTNESESQPVAIEQLIDRIQSSNSLPAILFTGGILLMVFIVMRKLLKTSRANKRRQNSLSSPSNRINDINTRAESSMDQSTRLMIESEDMARRLGAALDNKAARLELLLEEADRKLALLNQQVHSTNQQPTSPTQPQPYYQAQQAPPRTIDPALLDIARIEQDRQERINRETQTPPPPQSNGTTPQHSLPPQSTPTPPPPVQTPTQSKPIEEPKPISTRAYELSSQGYSNQEIAKELNQPIGQIELILNLRRQQKS